MAAAIRSMPIASYRSEYGDAHRYYRMRAGLSQNALAALVGINASYINRLESGEREAPTREVVQSSARALGLSRHETDELLCLADLVPSWLQKLGPTDSTVMALVDVLTNDRLSPAKRADLRAVVEVVAAQFGRVP